MLNYATGKIRGTTNKENQQISRKNRVGIGLISQTKIYIISSVTGTLYGSCDNTAKNYNGKPSGF